MPSTAQRFCARLKLPLHPRMTRRLHLGLAGFGTPLLDCSFILQRGLRSSLDRFGRKHHFVLELERHAGIEPFVIVEGTGVERVADYSLITMSNGS